MSIENQYRKLSDVEHVLHRPGRYIGSVMSHTANTYTLDMKSGKMIETSRTWNPGLLKLYDEILSNSIDHSQRPAGKHLNTIKVNINSQTGELSVWDNGGIPVVKHKEYNEWVPTVIFGYLRSGSNFNDSDNAMLTGQNGEGSSLVACFSTMFKVETADGEHSFTQVWENNMSVKSEPIVVPCKSKFTKITFIPDYKRLNAELNEDTNALLIKRVIDAAGCNNNLKFYVNDVCIQINSFQEYIKMYTDEVIYHSIDRWEVGITKSDSGSFEHVSFVNSTNTNQGGTHVDYVTDQIVDALRTHLKTKYKLKDIKPSEIKNHIRLFLNCRIVNPRYNSQTKECLITEVRDFGSSYKVPDAIIQKVLKSSVIEAVLAWAEAKAKAAEAAQLRLLNKETNKANPKLILKLEDASLAGKKPEECVLLICEGDSASKAIVSGRDAKTIGSLALKGKPLNINTVDKKKLTDNEEFKNIMIAVGLRLGEKVTKVSDLRYSKIAIATDADADGNHIVGLMISNMYNLWPELFELGVIHRFVTPLIKIWTKQGDVISFNTEAEFQTWKMKNEKNIKNYKYYKGLGTSSADDFREYLSNLDKHLIKIDANTPTAADLIDVVFGKESGSADKRKVWLDLQ